MVGESEFSGNFLKAMPQVIPAARQVGSWVTQAVFGEATGIRSRRGTNGGTQGEQLPLAGPPRADAGVFL